MVLVHNAIAKGDDDGENQMEKMLDFFGPGHVDQTVHTAIQACWRALPKERRTVEEVEKEIRRLVDRAISNLREDVKSFGSPK
jgi:tyrosine-protein phosphatase YwqE